MCQPPKELCLVEAAGWCWKTVNQQLICDQAHFGFFNKNMSICIDLYAPMNFVDDHHLDTAALQ